jgi:hypothetical protein
MLEVVYSGRFVEQKLTLSSDFRCNQFHNIITVSLVTLSLRLKSD